MNRNYYCKISSDKEGLNLLNKLKDLEEPVSNTYSFTKDWIYIGWKKDEDNWETIAKRHIVDNAIEVPASELIDYVTGKKVNKDALLEEAKRRYPIGTKFKSVRNKQLYTVETNSHRILDGNIDVDKVPWLYYNNEWAEIVEEPKIETKFEVGKWYKCSCNKNYFKYKNHTKDRFISNAVINFHTSQEHGLLGYVERLEEKSCLEYFDPNNICSLEEIQQYLPEGHPDKIKEEFVLPEKWFIKSTKSTASIIYDWLNVHKQNKIFYTGLSNADEISYICFPAYNNEHQRRGNDSYTEITFDQFKKYVLKEDVKEKTSLKVEDLVEGEIYRHNENGNILKWTKFKQFYLGDAQTSFQYNDGNWDGDFSIATPLEKKWLKTCIKQDKFIHKEQLDKYNDDGSLIESVKIPVEDNVKQNPLIFEEYGKFPYVIDKYFIGVDPIMTQSWGIYTQMTTISKTKTTLSIDDEELPMVKPSKEIKVTNKLTID